MYSYDDSLEPPKQVVCCHCDLCGCEILEGEEMILYGNVDRYCLDCWDDGLDGLIKKVVADADDNRGLYI